MSIASKELPKGWPRISASLTYANASKAIDWLCKAFGFEVQLKVEADNGKIAHSELVLGGGLISLGDVEKPGRDWRKTPAQAGGCTAALCVYVDDVDAHCARARAAGAVIASEPTTHDYGDGYWVDRSYEAIDLEGHHWWFMTRLEDKTGRA
ncbi:MAG TPA: VOC family protein [Kofleriaceae bacterium]|nr:VOC family protein [Kofleriaceae bacterium]